MQIFSEECDTKKNNGGALFGGGALYGENTVSVVGQAIERLPSRSTKAALVKAYDE